jgi:hypothetical protein
MDAFKKPINQASAAAPVHLHSLSAPLRMPAIPSKTGDASVIPGAQAPQPEHHVDAVLADIAASGQCLEEQPA